MKNLSKILLILITINFQLSGMQPPVRQPEEASFNTLPLEIKQLFVPLVTSSNVPEVAKTVLSLNHTNRFWRNAVRSEAGLICILEQMPYTANAIDLVELLEKKAKSLPVVQSKKIVTWVQAAKNQLRYGSNLFTQVALAQDTKEFEELMADKHINLNWPFRYWGSAALCFIDGTTPLMAAAGKNKLAMAEKLIAAGANVNAQNNGAGTALFVALAKKHTQMCERLVIAGADVNHKDRNGTTPLMFIIDEEFADGSKLLLQAGANPNLKNLHGKTALMTAAHHGDIYTTIALLEAGANPELTDNDGKTAYDFACQEVQYSGYRLTSEADYALAKGRIQTARLLADATIRYKAMQEKK